MDGLAGKSEDVSDPVEELYVARDELFDVGDADRIVIDCFALLCRLWGSTTSSVLLRRLLFASRVSCLDMFRPKIR